MSNHPPIETLGPKAYRLRASSIAGMMDCPARWAARHLDGKDHLPATAPAAIGTAVHASTGLYDRGRAYGDQSAMEDSYLLAAELVRNPDEEVDWEGMSMRTREDIAVRVHNLYVNSIGAEAVYREIELTLNPLTIWVERHGVEIQLTGTLDRVRMEPGSGSYGIRDLKTGKAAVGADGTVKATHHAPQLGAYQVLFEHTLGQPVTLPPDIVGLSTGNNPRVALKPVPYAREALVGTDDQPGFLDFAALYLSSGVFPANPSSLLCSRKYCPIFASCRFRA